MKAVHSYLDGLAGSARNTFLLLLLIYLHLQCVHGCERALVMTSFGSCRGPGAAKWDYTAGYFRGVSEEAPAVEEAASEER